MKKFLLLLLIFSLLISSFAFVGASAVAEETSPYDYATLYVQAHARRDILSGGEGAAAASLTAALTGFGYEVQNPSFRTYAENAEGSRVAYDYQHVVGYKNNGKDKCVLIGCYYGGYEPVDSFGVGNGGTVALSVGTLLSVASKLVSLPMDYDVAIAFWGGMEVFGDFNVKECGVQKDKIALYVNLDGVAVGDHDYLYADDLPRAHETYFRGVIQEVGANVLSAPVFKKQASLSYGGDDAFTYSHLGLLSTNRFFMAEDIPSVNFVSGAWDYDCGLYRYAGKGDIEGTSLDTIESIDSLNGGPDKTKQRMTAIANVVVRGVTGEGLAPALDKAAKETSSVGLNNSLAFYLVSFIGMALLIFCLIFLYAKQGKDRRDTEWTPNLNGENAAPYEEFHGEKGTEEPGDAPSDEDDEDDVFRF
ncbi:MAG: M28 family peptidase [Clostridia bacterium]|nr:M28 family peptidase [Clostridia bacterium]